ncbi:4'-phosphopantetheinyl transferase family protein [Agrobacterium sp. LMR679]|uniref:4'-phosphopantetheinyl transferase family protein n=1 Tax=Agrobacterium sp. LMR679 TaxID=3014335 RepID=UPI0022B062DF|nr:4'-phosphopantetheinyl transferase superfamily protein [Agrobacterium sp. LMR679]MCZ4072127.1 4'-phosphopantetheinyl transferase superfamily protein [Agrobacterium sp. LMR679]
METDWQLIRDYDLPGSAGATDIFLCEISGNWDRDALSTEELERAARLHPPVAHQFLAARTCLRHILSRKIGTPPSRIDIRIADSGKPMLCGQDAINFSLSHSGRFILIGMSNGNSIGVDIQDTAARLHVEADDLVLSERELRTHGKHEQGLLFTLWAKKEAAFKLSADGSFDPRRIEILSGPRWPCEIAEIKTASQYKRYPVFQLPAIDGYALAVAITEFWQPLRFWRGNLQQYIKLSRQKSI